MGLEKLLEETPEAYYWIGFIMADGCISKIKNRNDHQFTLTISIKDIEHLKKLSNFIDVHILEYAKIVSIIKKDENNLEKIIEKFDFKEKKTYNPPVDLKIKNDILFVSFMIGYIDGDGCISTRNDLAIECHYSWNRILNSWFERLWDISECKILNSLHKVPKSRIRTRTTRYGVVKSTIIQTCNKKFVNYLKHISEKLNLPCLKRKWDRVF